MFMYGYKCIKDEEISGKMKAKVVEISQTFETFQNYFLLDRTKERNNYSIMTTFKPLNIFNTSRESSFVYNIIVSTANDNLGWIHEL